MTDPTRAPLERRAFGPSPRIRAALLAAVLTAGCTMPVARALGTAPQGSALVDVGVRTSGARTLVSRLTVAQLAALLGTSADGLLARVEALLAQTPLGPAVSGQLASAPATVQELIDRLRAAGLEPEAAKRLLESLLAPLQSSSEGLRVALLQILEDLAASGQLEVVAGELGIPFSDLNEPSLRPVSDETAASTVNTTIDHLSDLLRSAGGGQSLGGVPAPLVIAPVASPAGSAVELVGLPGSGGPILTTIHSSPGSTTVLGYTSSFVDNAFTIVSVKLSRSGKIVETVKLPTAGRLSISANGKATIARRRGSARHVGVRVTPVKGAVAAGTHSFTLRPRPGLTRAGRVTVSLVTSYKPTGGTANTKHKTVIFKRATRRAAKHR